MRLASSMLLLSLIFGVPSTVLSQDENPNNTAKDSLTANEDILLTLEDSLSIFNLIDSFIRLPDLQPNSQLAVRLGYNSNVASSERTLGISQFGLSPGVSYYHKSGAYADVSGYWSNEFYPSYYLTILSAGYLGSLSKRWSVLGEYSRYFYSDTGPDVTVPFKNSLGVSNFYDLKPLIFRLDYTFFFGDKSVHRILPGVMLNFEKRNWKKINKILFYPSFNVLFGTEKVTEFVPLFSTLAQSLIRIRDGLPLFEEREQTRFGAMNYSLSAPLSVSLKNWNFLLAYTYNFPKALEGEELGLKNSGFISLSLTRYINFK